MIQRHRLPAAGSLLAAGVWAALAAWHPTTTYHLGPAAVMAIWPLGAVTSQPHLRNLVIAVAGASGLALGVAYLLNQSGLMLGPTLGARRPLRESIAVWAVSTALVAAVGAFVLVRDTRRSWQD